MALNFRIGSAERVAGQKGGVRLVVATIPPQSVQMPFSWVGPRCSYGPIADRDVEHSMRKVLIIGAALAAISMAAIGSAAAQPYGGYGYGGYYDGWRGRDHGWDYRDRWAERERWERHRRWEERRRWEDQYRWNDRGYGGTSLYFGF